MEMEVLLDEDNVCQEYISWKAETLSKQTGHLAAKQKTGMWKQFENFEPPVKKKERTHFVVELGPGYRLSTDGDTAAEWSCPMWKEHGCPATFSARLQSCPSPPPEEEGLLTQASPLPEFSMTMMGTLLNAEQRGTASGVQNINNLMP